MKKTIIAISLLIILIVGVIFAINKYPSLQTKAIATYSKVIGKTGIEYTDKRFFVPVYQTNIGFDKIFAKKGYIEFIGSYIASPEGFENKNITKINKISFDLDVNSLATDTVIINNITFDGFDFVIEDKEDKNNIIVLGESIIAFLDSNLETIIDLYKKVDPESPESLDTLTKEVQKIILGDAREQISISKKSALAFLGGDKELFDRIQNLYKEDLSDEYNEEINYWAQKNIIIKDFVFNNNKISYGETVFNIPNIALKDMDLSNSDNFYNDNKVLIEEFSKNVMDQEDEIIILKDKVNLIIEKLSENTQMLFSKFLMLIMSGQMEQVPDETI